MEALEGREVPALYYWNPVLDQNGGGEEIDPRVSVGSNWTDQSGVRYSDAAPPGAVDDLYYTGVSLEPGTGAPTFPWSESYIDSSSGGTFNSIHLLAGYTGTVHLQVATTVGTFEQRNGAIAQESGGLDFYVTGSFIFTGGTLNNTSNLGTVHLQGATGTITPGTNGVTLGSTLSLEANGPAGTTLTLMPGEVTANNGAGLDVAEECELLIPEGTIPTEWSSGDEDCGDLKLFNDGKTTVDNAFKYDGGILVTKKSTLEFRKDATINGRVGGPLAGALSPSIQVGEGTLATSGTIRLVNGITLTVEHGIKIIGGGLQTTDGNPTIDGDLEVESGLIRMEKWGNALDKFTTLTVKRDFTFGAGAVWDAHVDWAANSVLSDKIKVNFNTKVVAGAKIEPTDRPAGNNDVNRPWDVLETNTFTDATEPAVPAKWGLNKTATKLSVKYTG